jgi:nucleotidyltransferase substrate binding protein (TIGR01987 family)
MANEDIRWIQRFNNYRKALARLGEAVALAKTRELSDLEQQGLIQGFEFTCDMGWKTLQDFVVELGYEGEREKPVKIFIDAATRGIINEKDWRSLYQARCKTSHSYDERIADDIAENIIDTYYGLFIQLETRLQLEKINEQKSGKQLDLGLDEGANKGEK